MCGKKDLLQKNIFGRMSEFVIDDCRLTDCFRASKLKLTAEQKGNLSSSSWFIFLTSGQITPPDIIFQPNYLLGLFFSFLCLLRSTAHFSIWSFSSFFSTHSSNSAQRCSCFSHFLVLYKALAVSQPEKEAKSSPCFCFKVKRPIPCFSNLPCNWKISAQSRVRPKTTSFW